MIRPTKFLDLESCVINIAAFILAKLSVTSVVTYDELLSAVEMKLTPRARNDFVLALDMLYLLGKISYNDETDSLRAPSELAPTHGTATRAESPA